MNAALARGLYFTLQRLRGEPLASALEDVRRCERLSLDELRALQASRQRAQLHFALEHVPRYQHTLGSLRSEIARARDWDSVNAIMQRLPIVEKGSVMDQPADFTARTKEPLTTYADKTSGSSGTPVVFPCDQRAWAYRHALMHRGMEAFGIQIGEPYALFFGLHWDARARAHVAVRDRVLNRVRVSAYDIGPAKLDAHYAAIRRRRPTHFQGYPSAVFEFCTLAMNAGVDLRELRLKAVVTTAEPLRAAQREVIERATGAPCMDSYGSSESGVLAIECPAGGLHTTPEATWLELRDTQTHRGEAIVTDMMLRAFPMIRYALGDEIVLRAGTCACGRNQPMLASIEGRSGQPIELPNGRIINPNVPSYIFKPLAALGVIRRYRFVQRGSELELLLSVTGNFTSSHLELVRRETLIAFGGDLVLKISVVDEIPHLTNAKHRDYVRLDG
ncbi:MAG: hypothetical protein SFX73_15415 [Kofleriaceae bacterium]|nr:hypothetical protein [Kofleriaceae bacterium]